MASAAEVQLRPDLVEALDADRGSFIENGDDFFNWNDGNPEDELRSAMASTLFVDDTLAQTAQSILHLESHPGPLWADLSHGAQWLIFKLILEDGQAFSTTAVCLLRLSREEIFEFVKRYLAEHKRLRDFIERARKISQGQLAIMAKQRGHSVEKMLFYQRPKLTLDRIIPEDLEQ